MFTIFARLADKVGIGNGRLDRICKNKGADR